MCIAIVKTKEGKITDEQLRNCFKNNPHGAGFAYVEKGVLYYLKGIFDADQFVQAYHEIDVVNEGAMLIHCRISTSGLIDKDNCHPHIVHDNLVMIHNGVLDIDVPKDSKKSDTVLFVEKVLRPLQKDFMYDAGIMNLLRYTIGDYNKFCFLNDKGEYAIVNEEAGTWVDGVWFSNDSYKEKKVVYTGFHKGNDYKDYRDSYINYWEDEGDITEYEKEQLRETITNLSYEDLAKLGVDPVYDIEECKLRRSYGADSRNERHLYDIDEDLSYLYEVMFYDYFGKFIDDTELTEDSPDWVVYYKKYWSEITTTDDEDVEFEDAYWNYSVNTMEDVKLVPMDYSSDDMYERMW